MKYNFNEFYDLTDDARVGGTDRVPQKMKLPPKFRYLMG